MTKNNNFTFYNNSNFGFSLIFIVILISTIILILTAAGIHLNLIRDNFSFLREIIIHQNNIETGLNLTLKILKEDFKDIDTLQDIWNYNFPIIKLDDKNSIQIKIEAEDSKFNLNNLLWGNDEQINGKLKSQLDSLFFKLNLTNLKTDAIIDWLDKNNLPLPEGAENDYYISINKECKNGKLDSLDEIFNIKDFDKIQNKNELLDYITIYGDDEKININTASETVIEALSDYIDKQLLFEIIKYREKNQIKNLDDLLNINIFEKKVFDFIKNSLRVTNNIFKISITSIINNNQKKSYFIVERNNNNFKILFAGY
ncbi:MAG TPA: type II secretion system protein GspK [bacterium]|nr:type II secretion system protein GspK [bacterium]HOL48534.1 type II secretion system protein GspK [bacterium]HPQ19986.1 type II secretion system protein GspK [bacterium]